MVSTYFKAIPSIPRETVRAASASFGRGNFYIQVGEHLDAILEDIHWWVSTAQGGILSSKQDPELALITFFQFVESLTDAQASDAMRTRIDWKFALHLSLLPRRLDENALCRFRESILSDPISQREYQVLIDRLVRLAPALQAHPQQLRSLDLVSQVCSVNQLTQIYEAMDKSLEVLATRFPQWLRTIALPHWYGRYNPAATRLDGSVLPGPQRFLLDEIELDIQHLLGKVRQSGSPEIASLPEVKLMECIWLQRQSTKSQKLGERRALSQKDCEICSQKGAGGRR